MKAKLKSWEQLQSEGFVKDYPQCYKGSKRTHDCSFSASLVHTHLGEEVEIFDINQADGKIETAAGTGRTIYLPFWLFEDETIIALKPESATHFYLEDKRDRDRASFYKNHGFQFPCGFSNLSIADARKLAEWVLKISEPTKQKSTTTKRKAK